jgi:hypothetical protein
MLAKSAHVNLCDHDSDILAPRSLPEDRKRRILGQYAISLSRSGPLSSARIRRYAGTFTRLAHPAASQTIERCAQRIKGGFSHQIRTKFRGEIWQAGFHDHRVRDASDFRNQLEYIALNPIRRGLQSYAYVHTEFSDRLDPAPISFN